MKIGSATKGETNNIKFLGIIFDKHLKFKNHVEVIARTTKIILKCFRYYFMDVLCRISASVKLIKFYRLVNNGDEHEKECT